MSERPVLTVQTAVPEQFSTVGEHRFASASPGADDRLGLHSRSTAAGRSINIFVRFGYTTLRMHVCVWSCPAVDQEVTLDF